MFPVFELLGRSVGLFQIMLLCAIFSSGIYACRLSVKFKYDYTDIIIFSLISFAGAVIGSNFLYVLVNYRNLIFVFYNLNLFENIFDVFKYIFGGTVFYGGLLGGVLTGFLLIKKNIIFEKYADIAVASIPLFHFFGRIGCFLGGCCYGIPCEFGFIYKYNPIIEANGITRFPVQLLEAVLNIVLFFLLNHLLRNGKFKNKLIYIYLSIYAIGRFFIEYLRGDAYRGIWFVFSTSQLISIIIILFISFKIILYKLDIYMTGKK